ncbi:MAG: NAD(P)/FAD-dependent oxidoreductase [Clostridiales bacterium]|jgi:glycerol-3-phosphate dehydrogenase|nr:NAD(P)/FAD-dependent oxidoreductase [Clostridiales bacterium]MCI2161879.1 NAD(P)/FAD-dependent oxidoreductase [Oscillospiraceae bacterium]MCI1962194.1 NAD(P)/FAD-dependent oxidoreductase [Clostridiales bacterium]MCI2022636.1 NAD(P)/FAD-dependent oxidoreductase [Clostridiales bacterium]MCI2027049.1 NAD(P)/FAD-dependent oxidoreductase [Clostridiales bacterium]
MRSTDVLVIGAGAVGCSIARELTKYQVRVLVVEKKEDVGGDASKANSAIIHTGYDASPDTLESQLVVAANPMYDKLTKDLDVPFSRIGGILPAITQEQYEKLPALKEKAFKNRVYDVEYLPGKELLKMEPNLNPETKAGLYIPRESIIDPFLLVVGYAENAQQNGADFLLGTEVTGMHVEQGKITVVETTAGEISCKWVVNAAGLHCDEIAAMVGKNDYTVNPRKGQFYVLDKNTSCKVEHIILPIPTKVTKGKLMCPTIHGNMLVGPTAEDLSDKEDRSTDAAGLKSVAQDVRHLIPNVNLRDTITQYSGLRPNRNPEGLHVDTYDDLKNYVNLSGVRSTGLTASASLGKYVAQTLLKIGMPAEMNPDFNPVRKGIVRFRELTREQQDEMIQKDPLYGRVICRCETITEGEIVAAIHSPIPARSMDAVKRRVRAGLGRCQGGFCGPRVLEILARELGVSAEEINKNDKGSYMIAGKVR